MPYFIRIGSIMKKYFAAIFAATAVLGVNTAFASNLSSDVTPDFWDYQAVSQLASAGIVNGYPDGTFKGQKDITRYEMVQMIAGFGYGNYDLVKKGTWDVKGCN